VRESKQTRTKYYELDNPDGQAKLKAFQNFAKRLMTEFLGPKWEFDWMRDRCKVRTMACCTQMHGGKIFMGNGGWLLFSRDIVLRPPEARRDTIMHEIAHALTEGGELNPCPFTRKEAVRKRHHGPEWLAKARELGVSREHLERYE
jgi:hypothetical protein